MVVGEGEEGIMCGGRRLFEKKMGEKIGLGFFLFVFFWCFQN